MEIKSTKKYEMFGLIKGNREVNKKRVEKIATSIEAENLLEFSPILVNERMEVIDGQHRLAAAKLLGVDIYYRVLSGGGFEDCVVLNTNTKAWSLHDYVKMYAAQGNPNFIGLAEFIKRSGRGFSQAMVFVHGANTKERGVLVEQIKKGTVVFNGKAVDELFLFYDDIFRLIYSRKVDKRCQIWMNGRRFAEGLLRFYKEHEGIIKTDVLKRHVEEKIESITNRGTTGGFYRMFVEIYNHRLRGQDRRIGPK